MMVGLKSREQSCLGGSGEEGQAGERKAEGQPAGWGGSQAAQAPGGHHTLSQRKGGVKVSDVTAEG